MAWSTILWALNGAAIGVLAGLTEAWGDHRRGRVGPGRAEWLDGQRSRVSGTLAAAHLGAALCGRRVVRGRHTSVPSGR